MTKRTIILPRTDNDGRPLTAELAAVESELLTIAGGFTKLPATGEWSDGGHVYHDRNFAYWATVDDAQDVRIMAAMPAWCQALRQVSLYTDASPVSVSFVSAPSIAVAA